MGLTIAFDYDKRTLSNGFFAVNYGVSGWVIYHEDNPRQGVWNTVELKDAQQWSKLPNYKKLVEDHGIKAAITKDGYLEIYSPCTIETPFGPQNGFETTKCRTLAEVKEALGY